MQNKSISLVDSKSELALDATRDMAGMLGNVVADISGLDSTVVLRLDWVGLLVAAKLGVTIKDEEAGLYGARSE